MRIVLGPSRTLTDRFFGFNTPVMWDIPFEDPKATPLFAGLHAGLFRFPGGLIANHWNWRTGRVAVPPTYPGSFRAGAEDAVRLHPQGSSYEDFAAFAAECGAQLDLVLNIETATVEDQVDWIRHLVDAGVPPTRLELGNELYFAPFLGGSERFPDAARTLEISKEYIDALRPLLPETARFAVLSAGSQLDHAEPDGPFGQYLADWDAALGDADFYDATVVHAYPELVSLLDPRHGMASIAGATRVPLPGVKRSVTMLDSEQEASNVLHMLLARVEEGTRRQVELLDRLTGDKEIWVTEWGIGENAAYYRGENPPVTALWVQVMARHLQAFLRHPSITQALNHSLYFDGRIWSAMRRVDDERQYRAVGAYDMFRWFGEALDVRDGEIVVHDATVDGASSIVAPGDSGESYTDVTATVIDAGQTKRSALVQNTSTGSVTIELAGVAGGRSLAVAEMIHSSELRRTFASSTPPISPLTAGPDVTLPANSFARLVWRS